MSRNTRRTAAFAAATGSAVLVSLASVGSASAAIAGANPSAFTNRPNLKTVAISGNVASFTFDQPVNIAGNAGNPANGAFQIGGYQAGQNISQTPIQITAGSGAAANTVRVIYPADPSTSPDLANATYGTVAAGAVTGNGTFGNSNFLDSTALSGSTSNSGTAGHSTAPDLASVAVDTDANRITYTFDQKLNTTSAVTNGFSYTDANGTVHTGGAAANVLVSDYQVSVQFSAANDVSQAVTGNVAGASVTGRSTNSPANFPASQAIPGTSGTSVAPRLVSATLIANTGQIEYKFDRQVTAPQSANFIAGLSNGQPVQGTGQAVVTGDGTTVRVPFGTNANRVEHVVYASVNGNAVTSSSSAITNAVGGAPVGGNAGALASGYTTAPDAQNVTFNSSTGEVDVRFDSRLQAVNPAAYALYNSVGTQITGAVAPSAIQFDQNSTPQPTTVRIQFTPDQVKAASTLVLAPGAATNTIGNGSTSIAQTLAPSANGSTFAKFGASKKSITLHKATALVSPSSALSKAYLPTKNKAQALRNAKVIVKALSSSSARTKLAPTVKIQKTGVKKAAR